MVIGMKNYLVISEQQMKTRQSPPQSAVRNINSLQSQMLHLPDHQNLQITEDKISSLTCHEKWIVLVSKTVVAEYL